MNKTLNFSLKILAIITFALSCLWSYYSFGFEPIIVAVTALTVLIGLFVEQKINKNKNGMTQTQMAGNNSQNYQAGGNITVNQKENDKR